MQIAQMWRKKCRRWNTGALELIWTLKAVMLGLFFILFAAKTATALNSDGKALLSFKQYLKDSNSVLPNWSASDSHPCDWIGVQCDRSKRVTSLNLPFRHLVGTISPDIGKLAKLKRLGLHHNNFYGSIPPEIGNCTNLRALYLCSNYLAGTIPMALGKLTRLRVLDMASNSLTGSIPLTLGNLSNLRFLNLSKNSLIGEIPATGVLANFTNSSFDANLGLCGFQINRSCEILSSAPSPYVPGKQKAHKYTNGLWMSALGTVGISLFLVLMCFWGFFLYNKFGSKQRLAQINSTASTRLVLFHGDLPYTADDLIKKLNALNETDIIGSGGFGTVYRLVMDDGNMFAVKRIGKGGACTEQPFERELEILGSIKHRNLVNLRGYCNSPIARLLIYDFLSHGSLDQYLHDRGEPSLNWSSRLRIAVGAARGLSYLHHDCSPRIVHRDIKSSNILLDGNLEPHVSDFGLAKILEDNDSHVTTIVAGTFGYLAPEYMQSGRVTEKGDVYSYGVVLLELLSGRRPTDPSFVAKGLNIVGWVNTLMKENKQKEIFDPKCEGGTMESMEAVLQVAALCITPAPEDRPSMEDVVKMLDGEIMSPCQSDYYDSSSD